MKSCTLADIVISAQFAAQKAFAVAEASVREKIKRAEFAASGFDRAHYPSWESAFNAQLRLLAAFGKPAHPAIVATAAA